MIGRKTLSIHTDTHTQTRRERERETEREREDPVVQCIVSLPKSVKSSNSSVDFVSIKCKDFYKAKTAIYFHQTCPVFAYNPFEKVNLSLINVIVGPTNVILLQCLFYQYIPL